MDTVFIDGLRLDTVIGVYDWERDIRQTLELDLELGVDTRPAGRDDDLAQTLDYKAISDRLIDYAAGSDFELLEAMAEGIAELLAREFGVNWLRLRLAKPGAVAAARSVGIRIERGERS